MLDAVLSVTLSVPRLEAVERAYTDWFGYRRADAGRVSASLAAAWDAPRCAGSRWMELRAPAERECVLRLVERPAVGGFAPLCHHGWAANELLCQDPDSLAASLTRPDSPFTLIGPPAPLGSNPRIVALQALGPAGELVYLTRLPPEGGSLIKTPARTPVDRSFIVVVAGPSMQALQAFYSETLGQTVSAVFDSPVGVLNTAHGRPPDATTPLALVALSEGFALELDEYPATATPRPQRPGDLPPGIAMVGFRTGSLDTRPLGWQVAPARRQDGDPGAGWRAGLLIGPAGERLEILEPP